MLTPVVHTRAGIQRRVIDLPWELTTFAVTPGATAPGREGEPREDGFLGAIAPGGPTIGDRIRQLRGKLLSQRQLA